MFFLVADVVGFIFKYNISLLICLIENSIKNIFFFSGFLFFNKPSFVVFYYLFIKQNHVVCCSLVFCLWYCLFCVN